MPLSGLNTTWRPEEALTETLGVMPGLETVVAEGPAAKAVLNEQVLAFLKKNCRHCWGKGLLRVWVYLDEDTQVRQQRICRCARDRFLKANKTKIRETPEGLEWLT